jgi:polar amino acid transport system permease protein
VTDIATKERVGALPTLPRRTDGLSLAALLFAGFCILCAWAATRTVAAALDHLQIARGSLWNSIFFLVIAATAVLFWPAIRSWSFSKHARDALGQNNIVEARIDAAAAREWSYITFGWGAAALVVLAAASFIMANNAGVGKTFFYLPLILDKWNLVVLAFWNNIKIFVIAEILVLIWGLIVAIGRLMPGDAGLPVRMLAIAYCDIFRGLPAVLTLYLVGFGLPISGLPDLVIPPVVGLFVNFDGMTAAEIKQYTRIPLTWYCILALTLT